jgi:hypothetical protein
MYVSIGVVSLQYSLSSSLNLTWPERIYREACREKVMIRTMRGSRASACSWTLSQVHMVEYLWMLVLKQRRKLLRWKLTRRKKAMVIARYVHLHVNVCILHFWFSIQKWTGCGDHDVCTYVTFAYRQAEFII